MYYRLLEQNMLIYYEKGRVVTGEKMRKIFSVILLMSFVITITATVSRAELVAMTQRWEAQNPNSLPHWMTPEEMDLPDGVNRSFVQTTPPTAPVRVVAEFEPASAVIVRYPVGITYTFIAQMSQVCPVITIASSTSQATYARSIYRNNGANLDNCSFIIADTDSYWTRDFGPWFVIDGNNQLGVVDNIYNRPRPNDDEFPRIFAQQNGLNLFGMPLEHTGGNWMSDGMGIAASTTIAYTENSNYTHAQVNQMVHDYLGINTYHVIQDPNNTYIDHIDCWGKFLAPDKIMIRSVPTSHTQYSAIEQVAQYFANQTSSYGTPYRVYRVYTPNDQPYTNALILNKRVYVPITGSSNDSAALQSYRTAMPGYEVIGVTEDANNPWESTDALHCRTHEVADKNMLYTYHIPIHGTINPGEAIPINAYIYPYSQQPVFTDSLAVYYRVNNGGWNTTLLTSTGNNNYTANIPAQNPGATVQYYIHAADQSGRSINSPYMGSLDPFTFQVSGDAVAPNIVFSPIHGPVALNSFPLTISAYVTDNISVSSVVLEYSSYSQNSVQTIALTNQGEGLWSTSFTPSVLIEGDSLLYRIIAKDNATPVNTATTPYYTVAVGSVANNDPVQAEYLLSVYPNPYRPAQGANLGIRYYAQKNGVTELGVYNIKGQQIRSLVTNNSRGAQQLYWDGKDNKGRIVSPGIYFFRLVNGTQQQTKKILVTK